MTFTHTGRRAVVGRRHTCRGLSHQSRLTADDRPGVVHALNGPARPYEGARYRALCGREVVADTDLDCEFNVRPGGEPTCERCRASLKE